MKKLFLSLIFLICAIVIQAQVPAPTSVQVLTNGAQMGVIRNQINTNFSNNNSYVTRLRDSINIHTTNLYKALDSLSAHNLRLRAIEKDTATYGTGGTGGTGSSYTFGNAITESGGTVSLGGNLNANTTIVTGSNTFSLLKASSIPSSGYYGDLTFSNINNIPKLTLSSFLRNASVNNSGSSFELSTSGFTLYGKASAILPSSTLSNLNKGVIEWEYDIPSSSNYAKVSLGVNGLEYGGEYTSKFTNNSLVTKYWVENNSLSANARRISTGVSDTGIYINNYGIGLELVNNIGAVAGISMLNLSSNSAISMQNSSTGNGVLVYNTGPGKAYSVLNTGSGTMFDLINTNASGKGIELNMQAGMFGIHIDKSGIMEQGAGIEVSGSGNAPGINLSYNGNAEALEINNSGIGDGIDIENVWPSAGTALRLSGLGKLLASGTMNGLTTIRIENDSLYLDNQVTGEREILGLTPTGALIVINSEQSVQIRVIDTTQSVTVNSGYVIGVFNNLANHNLSSVEIIAESEGTSTVQATAYRKRGASEVDMTSNPATFNTDAIIDTANDDLAKGDFIEVRVTIGAGTPPEGVKVQLTFTRI